MAKMKFYLNFEGEKLRTLDDLRENFFADSVLTHYQSGKLAQWLDVWGYQNELEQVRAIQATDTRGVLSELGRIFGVEIDMNNIEQKIEAANSQAQQKNALDAYKQGLNYYNAGDYQNAIECFRKAAEMGHAEAQFVIGTALFGNFHMLDNENFKRIVTANDASSWFDIDFSKFDIKPNHENALDWLYKSAEQGYSWGQMFYGMSASAKYGNNEEELKGSTKAAEQGNIWAMMVLFNAYAAGSIFGEWHIEEDESKALFWLRKLAEKGFPDAKEEFETKIQDIFERGHCAFPNRKITRRPLNVSVQPLKMAMLKPNVIWGSHIIAVRALKRIIKKPPNGIANQQNRDFQGRKEIWA